MTQTADIQVASHTIGMITLDEARVTGEAGPHDPRLVLPLTFTFNATKGPLALDGLLCSLHAGAPASPQNQYGPTVSVRPWASGLFHATPASPVRLDLRIPLSLPLAMLVEARRHAAPERAFVGVLHFTGTVSWVAQAYNSLPSPHLASATPVGSAPFDLSMGLLQGLVPFDSTRIEDLPFHVTNVVWVDQVLPGLGITQRRLVELTLPHAGGPIPEQLVLDFDRARRDYDAGLYRESIQKCRDIRASVEAHFRDRDSAYAPADGKGDKSSDKHVYNIVKRLLNLSESSPQYKCLTDTWNAWIGLASAAHHARDYSAADARACLYLGAILLDYLTSLFSPPPLGLKY